MADNQEEVKIFEEPTEKFMIIKGGLTPDEIENLERTLESIENRLRETLIATRSLHDSTNVAGGIDKIKANFIDINNTDIVRFENHIIEEGFYPKETFEALEPLADAFISHAQEQINKGSAPPNYSYILSAAKKLKEGIKTHHPNLRELPQTEPKLLEIQRRISISCQDIITAIPGAIAPTPPPPGDTTAPPASPAGVDLTKVKQEAENIRNVFSEIKNSTQTLLNNVGTNPAFEELLTNWIKLGVSQFTQEYTYVENLTKANGNQPSRNMAVTLATFANAAAIKLDQTRFSPTSSPYMDKAGIQDLIRKVQELGTLASAGGGTVIKEIKDEVRQTDIVCREILTLFDTLSTTPFYTPAPPPPPPIDPVISDEEKIQNLLQAEIAKLNFDLKANLAAETAKIQQVRVYLEYLIQVNQAHQPYRNQVNLSKILPQLERMDKLGFDVKKIYEDYNYSIWTKYMKTNLEKSIEDESDKELADIKELKQKLIKRFQSTKGTRGEPGLREEKIYSKLIDMIERITKKVHERGAKIKELRIVLKNIPLSASHFTELHLKSIVDKTNQIEREKNHVKALDTCIEGLQKFLGAHQKVYELSEKASSLLNEIQTLSQTPEIRAISGKRTGVALALQELNLKQFGTVIKPAQTK